MALDGVLLACLRRELADGLSEARIDKIHQPGREELLISLRTRGGARKLYLGVGATGARIHFTADIPENPAQPPMFCMLLRKRLTGGRLVAIRQEGLERVLALDFDCISELGDRVRLTLAVELTGRHSNLILIGPDGRILDAIKRVDPATSTVRPILPGLPYEAPAAPAGRLDLLAYPPQDILAALRQGRDAPLSQALQETLAGLSPLACREAAWRATAGCDAPLSALSATQWEKLADILTHLRRIARGEDRAVPCLVTGADGTPLEYSFQPLLQYGPAAATEELASFSALLDTFYAKRAATERIKAKSRDLWRVLQSATQRVARKHRIQQEELAAAGARDTLRLYGELINANMARIPPGAAAAELVNYYDEQCRPLTVPLNPALSAAANAQKYYKDYRRAQTAARVLTERIAVTEQERDYLASVADNLSRAQSARELDQVRLELESEGYLRPQKGRQKPPPPLKTLTFRSDDGFTILVGRNNLENDRLTLRVANGRDIWLHTKNIPGSHTILITEGMTPPARTLEQAAIIAATHSKAADSSQVPVDYTAAKYVKKPAGAKPGMVIYTDNRTAYVTPDAALCQRLKVE